MMHHVVRISDALGICLCLCTGEKNRREGIDRSAILGNIAAKISVGGIPYHWYKASGRQITGLYIGIRAKKWKKVQGQVQAVSDSEEV